MNHMVSHLSCKSCQMNIVQGLFWASGLFRQNGPPKRTCMDTLFHIFVTLWSGKYKNDDSFLNSGFVWKFITTECFRHKTFKPYSIWLVKLCVHMWYLSLSLLDDAHYVIIHQRKQPINIYVYSVSTIHYKRKQAFSMFCICHPSKKTCRPSPLAVIFHFIACYK